ncbi:MAG: L-threonylcarbamoyladenylate synthase [Kineosporiaceae bacterium]
MAYRFDCTEVSGRRRGIDRAVVSVNSGALVVFPVDSAYGLGCDAFSPEAVRRLRAVKGHTRRQPPPVLIGHARTLDGIADRVSAQARELVAAFWPGPLTLLCHAQPSLSWDLGDTGGTVAVRMPLHPLALELLGLTGPMAVTGAGAPGATGADAQPQSCHEVRQTFEEEVEVYLDAGHLTRPYASTIVDVTGESPRLLRAGALDLAALRAVVPDVAGADG